MSPSRWILVGQPNCGKSTLFNSVAGYRSVAGNFPGMTVGFTRSQVDIHGRTTDLIDLPGLYSLHTQDPAEEASLSYLCSEEGRRGVLINLIDASVLSRSLELTVQLTEWSRPMVVGLNMMDEAARKGLTIDPQALSRSLGVPVIPLVARKGEGLDALFRAAAKVEREQLLPLRQRFPSDLEELVSRVEKSLSEELPAGIPSRFAATAILEQTDWIRKVLTMSPVSGPSVTLYEQVHRHGVAEGLRAHRHDRAFSLFEESARLSQPQRPDWRQRLDDILVHPLLGPAVLISSLFAVFFLVQQVAGQIDPLVETLRLASQKLGPGHGLWHLLWSGLVDGFWGGLGLATGYLFPFFMALALLEDSGYLARVAYLVDHVMHRIGLHGLSVIPMVMGYGCTVPAVMATRILKSPRDRLITGILVTLVPCSARMVVILGLVGAVLGLRGVAMVYLLNALVVGLSGRLLSRLMPEISPGFILEMPRYHLPQVRSMLAKTWFRLKEFVFLAWPLLMAGSLVLNLIEHLDWAQAINRSLALFTTDVLGLPPAVGVVLIFGIMRKELALLLLAGALGASGTAAVAELLTPLQVVVLAVFTTFYVPCLATISVLAQEFGWRRTALVVLGTFGLAVLISLLLRLLGGWPLVL